MLTMRLPESVEKRLEHLAEATGRTKTFYIREAIIKYLDEMEAIYLAERVRSGEEKVYSSDELEKIFAVED